MDKNRPNGVGHIPYITVLGMKRLLVSKGNCVDGQLDGPVICAIRNSLYHGLYQKENDMDLAKKDFQAVRLYVFRMLVAEKMDLVFALLKRSYGSLGWKKHG